MPPEPAAPQGVQIPPGLFVVTTYGHITMDTAQCMLDMRGFNSAQGLNNIHYQLVPGSLVDKARNDSVRMLLGNTAWQYLIFMDGDMTFAPDVVQQLLVTAYAQTPWADAVGAYCQLRGKPYLPTIDTGTGTWEPTDARIGPIEVIRTGAACILVKRHVFEKMEYPWYGIRASGRPLDTLMELDNYARCKMDGTNPLRDTPAWATLERCAQQDASAQRLNPAAQTPGGMYNVVGEDSNFADKMRGLGFRIVVQTDAVCGHLERNVITPEQHNEVMRAAELTTKQAVGILA